MEQEKTVNEADNSPVIPLKLKNLIRSWALHRGMANYCDTTLKPLKKRFDDPQTSEQERVDIAAQLYNDVIYFTKLSIWQYCNKANLSPLELDYLRVFIDKSCKERGLDACWDILRYNILRSKRELRDYYRNHNLHSLDSIKQFCIYFLALPNFDKDLQNPIFHRIRLDVSEIEYIRKIVTATYIESWLGVDKKCADTIYHFAAHPYELSIKEGKKQKHPDQDDAALDRRLRSIMRNKLTKYYALHKAQDQYEKELIARNDDGVSEADTSPLYGDISQFERSFETDLSVDGKYRIIHLATAHVWQKHGFDVLEYSLFQRNYLNYVNGKPKDPTHHNRLLLDAWNHHYEYLETLAASYDESSDKLSSFKKYVCECVVMQRYEQMCRYHLISQTAQHLMDKECKNRKERKSAKPWFQAIAMGFWARVPATAIPFSSTPFLIDEPLDVMGYEDKINVLYSTGGKKDATTNLTQQLARRIVCRELLEALYDAFPPSEMPTWTDEDGVHFKAAAKFYNKEYNLVEEWLEHRPVSLTSQASARERKTFFKWYHALHSNFREQNAGYKEAVDYLKPKKQVMQSPQSSSSDAPNQNK